MQKMVRMAGTHEKEKWEGNMVEMHQRKVEKMIKSDRANDVEGRSTDLGERKKMRGCWKVVKQKGKNGQNIGNAMGRYGVCRTSR